MRKFRTLFLFMTTVLVCFAQTGIHKKIDKLILNKDFEEAEKVAKKAYQKYPNEPEVICALACVYRNEAYRSGLTLDLGKMGIKEGESGSFPLSIEDTSELHDIISSRAYYDRDEYIRAETLYHKIIEIDPTYLNAYFNLMNDYITMVEFDNYFKVVNMFVSNLRTDPDTPDYLLDQAKRLVEKEYYDTALKLYQIMVQEFPDRHEAKSDIGAIYFYKGKFYEACRIFGEFYLLHPEDELNLNNYVYSLILTEDFRTAFDLIKTQIQTDDSDYQTLFKLGLLSFLLNENYKEIFKQYIDYRLNEVKSGEQDFWYLNANQIIEIETEEKTAIIDYFEYLLDQFYQAEMFDYAVITANIVNNIEPTNFSILVSTSIYDQLNFYEKTVEYLGKIEERKKTDNSIMSDYNLNLNYGRINYMAENYENSIKYFTNCYAQTDTNAFINHYLGMSYLALKDSINAKRYFLKNQEMNDKNQMTFINYSIRELRNLNSK